MAVSLQPLISAITFLLIASLIGSCKAAGITTYWGRGPTEGTLKDLCKKEFVDYVNIAFLVNFGSGQTPRLSVIHPLPSESEIEYCQSQCIKVLISIAGRPNLNSSDDAGEVASYMWNTFLGGSSSDRPFGKAVLDGVGFHFHGRAPAYLVDLALALSAYNKEKKQVYLAAAPECPLPDSALDAVIKTGVIDYVWVEFFGEPCCQYNPGNTSALFQSWDDWASYPGVNALFLGIPASPEVSPEGGYILPNVLVYEILPYVKKASNYAGIMVYPYPHHHPVTYKSRLGSYAAAI